MAIRTKSFSCGHKGLGQQCNRCRAAARGAELAHAREQARAVAEAMRVARWDQLFRRQAGDLRRFPSVVTDRAVEIAAALASGTHFSSFRPDRMPNDRLMIRFELPLRYRLIGHLTSSGVLKGLTVFSHQDYSKLLPGDRPAR
ncbi:MAG: hypothetical protein ABIP13_08940 [Tepidiformaceae bacterium]